MKKYKNTFHRVKITDTNNLGFGIARIDGIVTFVPGTVTGDECEVKIIKETKSYFAARLESLAVASQYRILSDCPVSVRCGGCVYRHIDYEYEKQLKKQYVKNAFRKVGIEIDVADTVSDSNISAYRNKVQYPVSAEGEIGYYANHTHDIVKCDNCLLESKNIAPISSMLRTMQHELKKGGVRHVYIRSAEKTGQVMLCFVTKSEKFDGGYEMTTKLLNEFPSLRTVIQNINPAEGNVILGKKNRIIYGDGYIEDELCTLRFKIAPMSFYQVNAGMAQKLYEKAALLADIGDGDTVVDLFCGVGTVGMSVCRGKKCNLLGVEIVPEAIKNAKDNAKLNGVENARFTVGDANEAVPERADVVILDPPRKGCDERLIATLSSLSPKKIVYISCNPDTLARDVKRFSEKGYTADTVYPYDLFPRTGHCEAVLLLTEKAVTEK